MPRSSRRHTRRVRRTRRHRTRGAGYQTSQQFFNPDVLQPVGDNMISSQPTGGSIRPVMNSTFKVGGRRRGRVGGFSPSIMGSFVQNAQQAIVPLALYSAYHFMPKKSRNISKKRK
jgi:hypothetical protein